MSRIGICGNLAKLCEGYAAKPVAAKPVLSHEGRQSLQIVRPVRSTCSLYFCTADDGKGHQRARLRVTFSRFYALEIRSWDLDS